MRGATALKQPAMTKHPKGTASYYLRVATPGGSFWQVCTEQPRPMAEIIASMEEQIVTMRKMLARAVSDEPQA